MTQGSTKVRIQPGLWVLLALWLMVAPVVASFIHPKSPEESSHRSALLKSLATTSARLLSEEIRRMVEMLRSATELFHVPSLSNRESQGLLRLLYRQHPDISLMALLDSNNRTVVEPVYLAKEQIEAQQELSGKLPVSPGHLRDFLERIPVAEARRLRLAFSDPYVNSETNSILLIGALAIELEDGKSLWILGFEISLIQLQRTLSALSSAVGSRAFVVDEGGRVVLHPDGNVMLRREPFNWHPLVQQALAGKNFGFDEWKNQDGSKWEGVFWKMDLLDWLVVVERPIQAFQTLSWSWQYILWGIWLLLGLAALTLVAFKTHRTLLNSYRLYLEVKRQAEQLKNLQATMLESGKLSALGDLGAGVAHEFNNPLGGILGLTQLLLRRKKPDDPDVNFLQRIEQEAKRCKAITDNLLRFSESQALDHREPARVERVLDAALDLVTKKLESKRIQIVREYSTGVPRIIGHEGLLQRAFLNVLFNAETAMPEGGQLTVSTSFEGNSVMVRVRDTGIGIPPENLKRVFEPFFTTKSNWQGAGLGLTEVYHIVKQHQGEVRIESQVGKGTEVIFSFPPEKTVATNLPEEPSHG